MCKSIPGTQKHMTMDQRIIIEKGLDQGSSIRSIALQLGKDPTTISKEIKKHRTKSLPPLQVVVWIGPNKGRLHARPKGRVSQALLLVRL